jgi:glycosyltransferase involved in cell wall biosynthesis
MACGVPVVVPDYGAPAEFLAQGGGIAIAGRRWLWGEPEIDQFAQAISEIRANHASYSESARKGIAAKAALPTVVDHYLDFLDLPRSWDAAC